MQWDSHALKIFAEGTAGPRGAPAVLLSFAKLDICPIGPTLFIVFFVLLPRRPLGLPLQPQASKAFTWPLAPTRFVEAVKVNTHKPIPEEKSSNVLLDFPK